jgi:hypothetical protein
MQAGGSIDPTNSRASILRYEPVRQAQGSVSFWNISQAMLMMSNDL